MFALLILLVILGGLALYMALPRGSEGTARSLLWLASAGAAGLLVVLLINMHGAISDISRPTMVGLSIVAILSAARVITHRRPVYSALYFVLLILANAGLLLIMQAEFLATALVIIYAGAILVTYVFVIMLAQQEGRAAAYDNEAREPLVGCIVGFLLLGIIGGGAYAAAYAVPPTLRDSPLQQSALAARLEGDMMTLPNAHELMDARRLDQAHGAAGTTERIGTHLLTSYFIGMELAGILLLAAMVGAIAIARRQVASAPAALEGGE